MYFPFLVNLTDKALLIVGAGRVAYRKVLLFKKFTNNITIMAPEICPEMEAEIKKCNLSYLNKCFENGDTLNFDIVIAATDNRDVNKMVSFESKKYNKLVNVVDDPELCGFIVPSVICDENFLIAFSTFGKAPSLSRVFREEAEKNFDSDFNIIVEYLQSLRDNMKKKDYSSKDRERILIECSRKAFEYFRDGKSITEIKAMIENCN
ncbi:bifunctional precorrin-2 dehydrogenase/sirohydrochlorin ferrochelatase [Thermodesulfobium sp. 4217-1]|uniref:precorrin-2 dehydrogenase/sirohydrochlorin ferrochelatase family protein n=1 Tax=Thermodesulfobium sp. 4217-1 TaxID=3120013 RepID=UPI003221EE93